MTDEEPKQFRGFCHVTFKGTNTGAVEAALEFDGAEVDGREIMVSGTNPRVSGSFRGTQPGYPGTSTVAVEIM
eukprot:392943-Prorocentrum_minimum.AAC.3